MAADGFLGSIIGGVVGFNQLLGFDCHIADGLSELSRALGCRACGPGLGGLQILVGGLRIFNGLLGLALFGDAMVGNVMAIGIPFIVGAFLFGIGMQLAGVCATGTLYCCGEGQPRFWLVLLCYGIGTLISNQFRPELEATFSSQVVLAKDLTGNIWSGMLLNLALVAVLFLLFRKSELKRTGEVKPIFGGGNLFWRDGRFTVLTGGILIALLNSAVVRGPSSVATSKIGS